MRYSVTFIDKNDHVCTVRSIEAIDDSYVEIRLRELFPDVQKVTSFRPIKSSQSPNRHVRQTPDSD